MYLGDLEVAQSALHTQYGQLLRIASNEVVSSDPNAIPLIYPTQKPLIKTDWYVIVGYGRDVTRSDIAHRL